MLLKDCEDLRIMHMIQRRVRGESRDLGVLACTDLASYRYGRVRSECRCLVVYDDHDRILIVRQHISGSLSGDQMGKSVQL